MKNRKRLLLIALMTVVAVFAFAQQYDPESDFEVTKRTDGKSVAITKYVGSKKTVNIPQTIQGLPVTRIGERAFQDKFITSVTIPNSVTDIGYAAFIRCTSLTSVTIPDSVTTIDAWAFHYCESLTSITIPDSVTWIGDQAFQGCYSLASVTIPNGVTYIREGTFDNCTRLASITIPNSVTMIGTRAFDNCKSLTSITIPNSVTSIWKRAFNGCTRLASVTFQGTITDANFDTGNSSFPTFPGDLRAKYLAGGIGTYKTTAPVGSSSVWTKQ